MLIVPSGIPSSVSFGSATLAHGNQYILLWAVGDIGQYLSYSIQSQAELGLAAILPGPVTVSPSGLSAAAQLGEPSVIHLQYVSPSGIDTELAFGDTRVAHLQTVVPDGIGPSLGFGVPALDPQTISFSGWVSSSVGTPSLVYEQTIQPASISPVAHVSPFLIVQRAPAVILPPSGIGRGVSFGLPFVFVNPIIMDASFLGEEGVMVSGALEFQPPQPPVYYVTGPTSGVVAFQGANGTFSATLTDGSASIAQAAFQGGGGEFYTALSFDPTDSEIAVASFQGGGGTFSATLETLPPSYVIEYADFVGQGGTFLATLAYSPQVYSIAEADFLGDDGTFSATLEYDDSVQISSAAFQGDGGEFTATLHYGTVHEIADADFLGDEGAFSATLTFLPDDVLIQGAAFEGDAGAFSGTLRAALGPIVNPNSAIPVSVNQTEGGLFYPFLDRPEDDAIAKNVADLYVLYEDPGRIYQPPFYLTYLYGLGDGTEEAPLGEPEGVHQYDIIVVDSNDVVLIDTTTMPNVQVDRWSNLFDVIQWSSDTRIAKMVRRIAFRDEDEVEVFPDYVIPETPPMIQVRVFEVSHQSLRSVTVDGLTISGSDLIVEAGYNVQIKVTEVNADSLRPRTRLTISGVPNGEYPSCEQLPSGLYTINGVPPDANGNFIIQSDLCFRAQPQTTKQLTGDNVVIYTVTPYTNALEMHQDACGTCFTCDDVVGLYQTIINLNRALEDLHRRSEQVHGEYKTSVNRFNNAVQCRIDSPLDLELMPYCPCGLYVGVRLCNTETCKIGPVTIQVNVTSNAFDDPFFHRASGFKTNGITPTMAPYFPDGYDTWPDDPIVFSWSELSAGGSASARFSVNGLACDGSKDVTVTAMASWIDAEGNPKTAELTQVIRLLAPDENGKCGSPVESEGCP